MRRLVFLLVLPFLVACGGPDVAATTTRGIELRQIATLTAPTPTIVVRPTAVAPTVIPTIRAYLESQVTATAQTRNEACAQVAQEYARAGATLDPRKGETVLLLEILGFHNVDPSNHSPYGDFLRKDYGAYLAQCYG